MISSDTPAAWAVSAIVRLARRRVAYSRWPSVAPGAIATPFHARTPQARMDAMREATAMGRVGEAQDCVGAFLFLASNELSGYITGNIVHVNGGMYMP